MSHNERAAELLRWDLRLVTVCSASHISCTRNLCQCCWLCCTLTAELKRGSLVLHQGLAKHSHICIYVTWECLLLGVDVIIIIVIITVHYELFLRKIRAKLLMCIPVRSNFSANCISICPKTNQFYDVLLSHSVGNVQITTCLQE